MRETCAVHTVGLLDRPVWAALTSGWTGLALGGERAKRLRPEIGPFAAMTEAGDANGAALAALAKPDEEMWLIEPETVLPPAGMRTVRHAPLVQMVAEEITPGPRIEAPSLGVADAAEMHALAAATKPGPFEAETWRLGGFIGVRDAGGRLVAMAGERMRLPGHCEVSGVCTAPDRRGEGLAAGLMRVVADRIVARGERPILHAYAANGATIALYRRLGFERRRELMVTVIARR